MRGELTADVTRRFADGKSPSAAEAERDCRIQVRSGHIAERRDQGEDNEAERQRDADMRHRATLLTTIAQVPAKTRPYVPNISARSRLCSGNCMRPNLRSAIATFVIVLGNSGGISLAWAQADGYHWQHGQRSCRDSHARLPGRGRGD